MNSDQTAPPGTISFAHAFPVFQEPNYSKQEKHVQTKKSQISLLLEKQSDHRLNVYFFSKLFSRALCTSRLQPRPPEGLKYHDFTFVVSR